MAWVYAHRSWLLGIATVLAGCGAPGAPVFESRDSGRSAAEVKCTTPGFPQNIGQATVQLVDMDSGKRCTTFLEQDVCVLAIFRDCTDEDSTPSREWQGEADSDRHVELRPFYPRDAVIQSRSPACCVGEIPTSDGPIEWVKLGCRRNACNTANRGHVGLFWTRRIEPTPALTTISTTTAAGMSTFDMRPSGVWDDDTNTAWIVWPSKGLFSFSDGVLNNIREANDMTRILSVAQNDEFLFAVGTRTLLRINKETSFVIDQPLPLVADGVTVVEDRVIVSQQGSEGTLLRSVDPRSLITIGDQITLAGDLTGLTTTGTLAVATMRNPPRLIVLDKTLTNVVEVPMSTFEDLELTGVVPMNPTRTEPGRVAFVAECYAGAGKTHCVYAFDVASRTITERIGVPDEQALAGIALTGTSMWLGGQTGIHRAYRNPMRPEPADFTGITHPTRAIVVASDRLLAISEQAGQLTILDIDPATDP